MTTTNTTDHDAALAPTTSVDEEASVALDQDDDDARAKFEALVRRLSEQSVRKHFDAYEDIAWDAPEMVVDPADPRWEVGVSSALQATEWYQQLPQETRSEMGLYSIASSAKVGLQFENVLKRGLLEFAFKLDNGDPKFRYAYHEVIEEAQHGLMFQEFVNRSGYELPGLKRLDRFGANRIVLLGRRFPALFIMFVLGGEDPIDYVQREALRGEEELPPIIERVIRIHVTEEARHLSFARHYLKNTVPRLGAVRRSVLAIATPLILGTMAQMMMKPSGRMVKKFDIPRSVVKEAYGSEEHKTKTRASLKKVRTLCRELGLINPVSRSLWKGLGIYADD